MRTGVAPFIDAVWDGRADEVTALLAGGADANKPMTDGSGRTPLYMACREGHTEIATALIAAGAKVNQAVDGGATPLFIACQEGHTEIATALIAAGAKVNQAKDGGLTPHISSVVLAVCNLLLPCLPGFGSVPRKEVARRRACASGGWPRIGRFRMHDMPGFDPKQPSLDLEEGLRSFVRMIAKQHGVGPASLARL